MKQSYTTTFTVDQTPEATFAAINNVRGWWTGEIEGSTDRLGDEFTYQHLDIHRSKQRIIELVPDEKVVWLVVEADLNFTEDPHEWEGTQVVFEIAQKGDKTEVTFTHSGLVPQFECYTACSDAWSFYVNRSLQSLITTGEGQSLK